MPRAERVDGLLFSSFHPCTTNTLRPNRPTADEVIAALRTFRASPSRQMFVAYLETMARFIRGQTPGEAAHFKRMAERANVSDEEMEAFNSFVSGFFGGEPPPLAEVFGSDDAAKFSARIYLIEKAEHERGQASK